MSEKPPRKELIELPLSHKETWDTVAKGGRRGTPPVDEHPRRRLLWWLAAAAVLALAYWLFWPSAPRVEFDTDPLTFAEQLAGSTSEPILVTLTNVGERTLRVERVGVTATSEDFSTDSEDCSGGVLVSGSSCQVGLRFTPRAPGARAGELEVVGNVRGKRSTLALLGQAVAPRLTASPEGLDFGPESVGATSPGRNLELVNQGTSLLSIRRVTIDSPDGEFRLVGNECSSARLGPGKACSVRLVFKPGLLGRRDATLDVVSDSLGDSAPIRLEGMGSGPDLAIDPQGLVFESQLVGTRSAPRSLTLTSRGDEPFRFNRIWLAADDAFTVVEENCSRRSLAPSESCRVTVVFEPAREGEVNTSLQIRESSGGLAPGIGISGRAVSPRLEISARALDFGARLVGEGGASQSVRLSNAGTATLEISEIRVVGKDSVSFAKGRDSCSGVELTPGRQCEVELGFVPRHGGRHQARIAVELNQRGATPQIELGGHGRAPQLTVDRRRLDFAPVRQSESQDLRIEIGNTGDAPLGIGAVRLGGSAAPDFSTVGDGCSRRTLPPGETCRLVVRFTPTTKGPRDARLLIESDAPSGTRSMVLRGLGLEAPEPDIMVTPGIVEFGPQPVGQRSEVMTVEISSTGEGPLKISAIRLTGRDAGDFRVIAGTCQGLPHIVPGGDCTVGVRFLSTAPGPSTARLVIEHNARRGAVEIALTAEGL